MDEIEIVQAEPADDLITAVVKTKGNAPKKYRGKATKTMQDIVLQGVRKRIRFKTVDENGNPVEEIIQIRHALFRTWVDHAIKGERWANELLKNYLDRETSVDNKKAITTVDEFIRAFRKK